MVVDLYGPGAATDMNGAALTSANQAAANQSVSQTVSLPLNITSANLAPTLRCVLRFYLGDTRAGSQGPLSSGLGTVLGGGIHNSGTRRLRLVVRITSVQAGGPSLQFHSAQLPARRSGVLPARFAEQRGFSIRDFVPGAVTFSVTGDSAYSISNSAGGKIQFQQNSDDFGANFFGLNLSLDLTQSTTDTDSWDTTTTATTDTSVENDNTLTITQSTSQQITQSNTSPPGETASWEQEPFWNDTFELMVNPQFAVWDYPTLQLMQLLSCW